MIATKVLSITGAVAAAFLALGYASAWMSLAACEADTYERLEQRGAVVGIDLLGSRVVMGRDDVSAHVIGPFLVETRCTSPSTIHGSVHAVRYVVLPWWRHAYAEDEFALA